MLNKLNFRISLLFQPFILLSIIFFNTICGYSQLCGLTPNTNNFDNRTYSTSHGCVNESVHSNLNNSIYVPGPQTEIKTVRLAIHVMQREDGSLNLQQNNPYHIQWLENFDNSLNSLMSNLQEEYCDGVLTNSQYVADGRIRFKTDSILWHQDNNGWNNNSTSFTANNGNLCGSYCYDNFSYDQEHVLNIYLLGSTRTLAGYLNDPLPDEVMRGCGPGYSGPSSNYIMFNGLYDNFLNNPVGTFGDDWYIGTPWVEFPAFLHEIGHELGLHHSWYSDQEALFNLCDTDQNDWCEPIGTANCSNNFMSYSKGRSNFTTLQLAHMHQLLSGGWRTAMLCECIRDANRDIVISSDQTWITGKVFGGNVIVNTGVTLTIQCKVNMPKNGSIIIHPGARVVVDSGICTNSCGYYWNGFEVWGQSNERQLTNLQGLLELKNGAIIENAGCGVRLGSLVSTEPWTYDWGKTGGILRSSTGTVFKNNRKDVEFLTYQNYINLNGQCNPRKNVSYFHDTEFLVDKVLPDMPNLSQRVSMLDVDGIPFYSCNFHIEGDALTNYSIQNRGVGIYSLVSSFAVGGKCLANSPQNYECDPGHLTAETLGEPSSNIIPSRFSNYLLAIRGVSGDDFSTTSISASIFTNNQFGIFLKSMNNPSIYRNRFFIDEQNYGWPIAYGASLLACNGYKIERNIFEGTGSLNELNTGLWISSSPAESNEIYLNDFKGLFAGSIAQGTQAGGDFNMQGLELLCGLYENSKYNISVSKYGPSLGKIALKQGDYAQSASEYTAPAGNLFTQTNWGNFEPFTDYYICPNNDCGPIIYEHHNTTSSWPVAPVQINPSLVTNSDNLPLFTSRQTACPIHHGLSQNPNDLHAKVLLRRLEIAVIKGELEGLVDGGNTSSLQSYVNDANNSSANLRATLLPLTPYISDAILKTLIGRQPSLNPWHLCEILIACSPLNPDVFIAVDNSNQLSVFLFGLLSAYQSGRNVYTSKMSALKQYELEKANALSSFIRTRIFEDDENYYLEEVKELMTGEEINHEIKLKVGILRQQKNYSEAIALLANYDENPDKDVWKQVMTVLLNIDGGGGYLAASTNQIAELETLALSEKEGSHQASALHEILTGMQPEEELNLPIGGLKSLKLLDAVRRPSLAGVYPNPAHGEFYITYVLPSEREIAFIRIFDMQGKLVHSENITVGHGILSLNSRQLGSGSYVFELELNGQNVATEKFIIVE